MKTNTFWQGGKWLWTAVSSVALAACFGGEGSIPGSGSSAAAPIFAGLSPVVATIGFPTVFKITGDNFPLTAYGTLADGTCLIPANRSSTGFTVQCTPGGVAGSQLFSIRSDSVANGGYLLATPSITVSGTPVPPAPIFSSFSPTAAMLGQPTVFKITGENFPLTAYGTLADGTCLTPANRSGAGFTVECTPGGVASTQVFSIRSDTVSNGGYLLGTLNITVSATQIPPAPTFSGFSPTAAMLGQPTIFKITGANFPLTAYGTLADGTCLTPINRSSTGFTVECTPGGVAGTQVFSIRSDTVSNGGYLLGTLNITVSATPIPPAPTFSGFSPTAAMLGQPTIFKITGENFPLTAYGTLADGTCLTPANRSSTGFTVECTPGGVAGTQVFTIRSDTVSNGGYLLGTQNITVSLTPVPPAPIFSGFSPLAAMLGQPTIFKITGDNLPLTAYGTLADGTCLTPANRSSTGFTVECTPGGVVGTQVFSIRSDTVSNGGYLLGTLNITVSLTPVPPAPTFSGFSPTAAVLGQLTVFKITGENFPLTSYGTLANGTCLTPANRSSTGFTVECTPGGVAGIQVFTIRSDTVSNGGYLLGTLNITISATPVPPAPTFSGFSPLAATLGQPTIFKITGENFPLTAYGTLADGTCLTPANRSSAGFTVECTPGGVAGTQVFTIRSDTVSNGGYLLGTLNITVSATQIPPAPTFSGFSPTATMLGQPTVFKITGENFPLTSYGTLTNGTCLTPINRSSTGFSVQCTPGGVAGTQLFSIRSDTVANGGYLLGTLNITVLAGP